MPRTCLLAIVLSFEQNQSKVYREVLVAGDLTDGDVERAKDKLMAYQFGWLSYGRSTPDPTEFVHDNDTVYFAQPSLSQFIPGGSGPGALNHSGPTDLGYAPGDTPVSTGKNVTKRDTGAVLRYTQCSLEL